MKNIFILLIILSLGSILRIHNLDKYPLWHDEARAALQERSIFSLPPISKFLNSKFSLQRIDYLFLYDHLFIYYWKKILGESEFNLRLSSVLFGILGLVMVYKLSKLIYNTNAALISSFLLVISPFHIYYSQELRPYTAISFFSLLSFYSLFKIIKDGRARYWIMYIIFNVINIYYHYAMFIVLLSEVIFFIILLKSKKSLFLKFIVSHLIILFISIPVILIIIPNLIFILTHKVPVDLTEFPIWAQKISFNNILFTLKNFSIGYNIDFYSLIGLVVTSIYLFLFIVGCYKDKYRLRVAFNIILLTVPIFLIFVISKFIRVCYVDRYFFAIFPLYILGISNGIHYYKKWMRIFLFIIVLIFTIKGLHNYYLTILPGEHIQHIGVFPKGSKINEAAQFIFDDFQKNDRIFCTSRLLIFPLKFYSNKLIRESDKKNNSEFTSEINEGKVFWFDSKDRLMHLVDAKIGQTIQAPQLFLPSGDISRIWVIHNLFDPRPNIINKIKDISSQEHRYNFKNLELYLFILQKEEFK